MKYLIKKAESKFQYTIDRLEEIAEKYGYKKVEDVDTIAFELEGIDIDITVDDETKTYSSVVLGFGGDLDENQDVMYLEAGVEVDGIYYYFEPQSIKEIEDFVKNPASVNFEG